MKSKRIQVVNKDVDIIHSEEHGVWYLHRYAQADDMESNEEFPTSDAARHAFSRGTVSWKAIKVL